LAVVQRWFQAVVTHPDGVEAGVESAQALAPRGRAELEAMITRSRRVSAHDRISIYANAYYLRLIECLGDSYPVLKRTLGEAVFNGFAMSYLQQYPSRSYTLIRLGDAFANFLDETRPDREPDANSHADADDQAKPGARPPVGWPDFLIDLARLEWTIEQVFDGPGIEDRSTLSRADFEAIDPARWPHCRLRMVPCFRLLELRFPVNAYYSQARRTPEGEEVPAPGPADTWLAITRRDYIVRRHEIDRPHYELLASLQRGDTIAQAVEAAAAASPHDDAALARLLREWFHHGASQQFFEALA
jgi:hypothetical protein